MNATARLPFGTNGNRFVGKGLGILAGVLGLVAALGMFFVPVSWETGPGVAQRMAGIDYLFGNATAEPIFHRATFVLLVSLSIIYVVKTEGIRVLWLITAIIGVAGIGGLRYGANSGKVLITVAVLLALSAGFLTVDHRYQ